MKKRVFCYATPFNSQIQKQDGLLPIEQQNELSNLRGIVGFAKGTDSYPLAKGPIQIPNLEIEENLIANPASLLIEYGLPLDAFLYYTDVLNTPLLIAFGEPTGNCYLPFGFQGIELAKTNAEEMKEKKTFVFTKQASTQDILIASTAYRSPEIAISLNAWRNFPWLSADTQAPKGYLLQSVLNYPILN